MPRRGLALRVNWPSPSNSAQLITRLGVRTPPKESLTARAGPVVVGKPLENIGGQVIDMAIYGQNVAAGFAVQRSNAFAFSASRQALIAAGSFGKVGPVVEFKCTRIEVTQSVFVWAALILIVNDRAIHDITGEHIVALVLDVGDALNVLRAEIGLHIIHVGEPRSGLISLLRRIGKHG